MAISPADDETAARATEALDSACTTMSAAMANLETALAAVEGFAYSGVTDGVDRVLRHFHERAQLIARRFDRLR